GGEYQPRLHNDMFSVTACSKHTDRSGLLKRLCRGEEYQLRLHNDEVLCYSL
ncbi:hypothetical protein J6590_082211, partial [Homalodisca vitripennis]